MRRPIILILIFNNPTMKKFLLLITIAIFLATGSTVYGQLSGTAKICPGTPFWVANKAMVENNREMFQEYAKGPDGCWWLKLAKHSSYKQGFYQFDSKTKYYYNKSKKFWETADRKSCLANPPFGR